MSVVLLSHWRIDLYKEGQDGFWILLIVYGNLFDPPLKTFVQPIFICDILLNDLLLI